MTIYPKGLPDHLVEYWSRGWAIFPTHGKIPLTSRGFKDASRDSEQWTRWAKDFPGCGWAAPTGEVNGFDVLDVDDPEAIEEFENRLPLGPRVRTGGGGMHFYLRHELGARNWAKKIPGCDFRADGGYVILSLSPHASGRPYEWVGGTADLESPATPTWIAELQSTPVSRALGSGRYVEGERNDRLFRIAAAVRAKGGDVLGEVRRSNYELCSPPLPDVEVRLIAASAERYPAGTPKAPAPSLPREDPGDDDDGDPVESFIELADGRVAEEILTPDGPAFLLYRSDPESWEVVPTVSGPDGEVHPVPVEPKLRDALTLADGVEEYGSTAQLLADAENWALAGYDPGKEGATLRLWVRIAATTWLYSALFPRGVSERYAPILPVVGPPESGKGRVLTVARFLTYRPLYFLKTTRVPSLFRATEGWHGTLILDEADIGGSSESNEFIEFLNARAYGNPIPRFSAESDRMRYFQSFGLTVLALRKPYEDAGFNSRTIPMRAAAAVAPNSIDLVASAAWIAEGRRIQRKLLLWRLRHIVRARAGRLKLPTRFEIPRVDAFRVRAALLPLAALGIEEPEVTQGLAELALEIQKRLVVERADSPEGVLLGVVYNRLADSASTIRRDEGGTGFRVEEILSEESLGEAPITRTQPLHLSQLSEQLRRELGPRVISRIWRSAGQSVRARARYSDRLFSGLLIISDPDRLDREFARYVPDWEPKAHLFRNGATQFRFDTMAAPALGEQGEQVEQQPPGHLPKSPPVQDVPLVHDTAARGEGSAANSRQPPHAEG